MRDEQDHGDWNREILKLEREAAEAEWRKQTRQVLGYNEITCADCGAAWPNNDPQVTACANCGQSAQNVRWVPTLPIEAVRNPNAPPGDSGYQVVEPPPPPKRVDPDPADLPPLYALADGTPVYMALLAEAQPALTRIVEKAPYLAERYGPLLALVNALLASSATGDTPATIDPRHWAMIGAALRMLPDRLMAAMDADAIVAQT